MTWTFWALRQALSKDYTDLLFWKNFIKAHGGAGFDASWTRKPVFSRGDDTDNVFVHDVSDSKRLNVYNGGQGEDTLVLDLSTREWMKLAPSLQREINQFQRHVDNHTKLNGDVGSKPFFFESLGVRLRNIENVVLRVDGQELSSQRDRVTANSDSYTITEGGILADNVTLNDDIPDLLRKVRLLRDGPEDGELRLGRNGDFTFDTGTAFDHLGAGESIDLHFRYVAIDATFDRDRARVTITVEGENDAPETSAISATTDEDTPLSLTPLFSDVDENDSHTVTVDTTGTLGSVQIEADGTLTYDPVAGLNNLNPGEVATDHFTYTIIDSAGASSTSDVQIAVSGVNDAPVVVEETTMGVEDQAVTIFPLANDSDPDTGDTLTIVALRGVTNGTAEIAPDGQSILFTPEADFDDGVIFEYQVQDSHGATTWGSAEVGFVGHNDAPDAVNAEIATLAGIAATTVAEFTDPDTYDDHVLSLDDTGLIGDAAISAGGQISYDPGVHFRALGAGESYVHTITYRIEDLGGLSDSAEVTITVHGENDGPTAADDVATTNEDTPIVITPLDNDTDPDATDTLRIVDLRQTATGTAEIAPDGLSITFTPDADVFGPVNIDYQIEDSGGVRDWATIALTVTPVNDAPMAQDLSAITGETAAVTLAPVFSDADPGDTHTVTLDTTGTLGQVQIEADGRFTYDPGTAFGLLGERETGRDSFTYTVEDAAGAISTARATVVINGANFAPVARPDTVGTDEDTPLTFSPLANDSDADTEPLRIVSIASATNGTVVISPDAQSVTFTPDANFFGPAGFTYVIEDPSGTQAESYAEIDVGSVNDTPMVASYGFFVPEADAGLGHQITPDFIDPDIGDSHTITVDFDYANSTGSSELWFSDGKINYSANGFEGASAGEERIDTILVTVTDAAGASDTGTITVSTLGVNDAPTDFWITGSGVEDAGPFAVALGGVSDPDGRDTHRITNVANATHGTATLLPDGTISFTPDADYWGYDVSMDVTIEDNHGAALTKTVGTFVRSVADPIELAFATAEAPEINQFYLDVSAIRLNPNSSENLRDITLEVLDASGNPVANQSAYIAQSTITNNGYFLSNDPIRVLVTIPDDAPADFSIRATGTAVDGALLRAPEPDQLSHATATFDVDWSKSSQTFDQTITFDGQSIWADTENQRHEASFTTSGSLFFDQDLSQTLIYLNLTAGGVGAKTHVSGAIGVGGHLHTQITNSVYVEGGQVGGGVNYNGAVDVIHNGVTDQLEFRTEATPDLIASYFAAGSPNFGFSANLAMLDFYLSAYARIWGYVHFKTGATTTGPEFDIGDSASINLDVAALGGSDGIELVSYDGARIHVLDGFWSTPATNLTWSIDSGEPYENELATVTVTNPTLASVSNTFDATSLYGGDRHELANYTLDLDGLAATIKGMQNPVSLSKGFGDFHGIRGPAGMQLSLDALDFDLVNRLNYQQNHILTPGDLGGTLVLEDGETFDFTFGDTLRVGTLAEHDTNGDGKIAYHFRLSPDVQFQTKAQLVFEQFDQLDILKAKLEGWINLGVLDESFDVSIGPWKSTSGNVIDREGYIPITTQDFTLNILEQETDTFLA